MMEEADKLMLMRLADGELDHAAAIAVAAGCHQDPAARSHIAALAADQAVLRAAFPPDGAGLHRVEAAIAAAFDARHRRAGRSWRIALPIAASVLTALVVGAGSVLVAERRAEDAAARVVAAFAQDRQLSVAAFVEALDRQMSGRSVAWRNPDSGSSGAITPLRTFRAADGRYCREYEQTLDAGGAKERVTGIACRDAGAWRPTLERPDAA
jgi:surface antigen